MESQESTDQFGSSFFHLPSEMQCEVLSNLIPKKIAAHDLADLKKWAKTLALSAYHLKSKRKIDETSYQYTQITLEIFSQECEKKQKTQREIFLHNLLNEENLDEAKKDLLNEIADPNTIFISEDNTTPILFYAIENDCTNAVDLLLQFESDPNIPATSNGGGEIKPPLYPAIKAGTSGVEMMHMLLENNANPNALCMVNGELTTLLHVAIEEKNRPAIRLLMNKGANPLQPDWQGKTAFDCVQQIDDQEIFLLFNKLIAINNKVDYGD